MPQMYPMMWTTLYMLFTLSLIFFLAFLHFSKTNNPPVKAKISQNESLIWKW